MAARRHSNAQSPGDGTPSRRARWGAKALVVAGATAVFASPAAAQQTLNVSLGYFTVRGEDARVERDVLNENRNVLAFDLGDFNGAVVGAEWLVPLGGYFEGGAGVGFSRRTVPSVYDRFTDRDGSEIEQRLRLRIVPVAFTVRVLPLGQTSPVQPYFGGGLGVFSWRYSESGEFVDFQRGNAIFREQYVASGSETGPIVFGGLRFAGDAMSGGFEIRYHGADAPLGRPFSNLQRDPRIDLGGWTYQLTMGWRFGG
ncbi:MAG: hypothetical protein HYY76_08235 [Acidobacteria bacterium]|nr:hypothetical protein [Acidobacteriota bacterium]